MNNTKDVNNCRIENFDGIPAFHIVKCKVTLNNMKPYNALFRATNYVSNYQTILQLSNN